MMTHDDFSSPHRPLAIPIALLHRHQHLRLTTSSSNPSSGRFDASAKTRAPRALRVKFLANASHDLCTHPITLDDPSDGSESFSNETFARFRRPPSSHARPSRASSASPTAHFSRPNSKSAETTASHVLSLPNATPLASNASRMIVSSAPLARSRTRAHARRSVGRSARGVNRRPTSPSGADDRRARPNRSRARDERKTRVSRVSTALRASSSSSWARETAPNARRRRKKTSNDAPPPRPVARGSDDEDSEEDVSDEDVRFVRKNAAYASFMTSGSFEETPSGRRRRRDDDDDDAPEAAHGRAMRARAEAEAEEEARKANVPEERKPLALPVKRLDGTVVRDATAPADAPESDGDDDGDDDGQEGEGKWRDVGAGEGRGLGKKAMAREIRESDLGRETTKSKKNEKWWEKQAEDAAAEAEKKKKRKKGDDSSSSDSEDAREELAVKLADKRRAEREALEAEMSAEARRESVKIRIASTCQGILEDPETRWKELKEVERCVKTETPRWLDWRASLTLVYRDICPGYRIRPPTDKELSMKVSKEVMKTRAFESGLLEHYKAYVKTLVRCSGAKNRARSAEEAVQTRNPPSNVCARCSSVYRALTFARIFYPPSCPCSINGTNTARNSWRTP